MADEDFDVLKTSERTALLLNIRRQIDQCIRAATAADEAHLRQFNAAQFYTSYVGAWDDQFARMQIALAMAQQAKVELDRLLTSKTESATYYPAFNYQPIFTIGKGGLYRMNFGSGTGVLTFYDENGDYLPGAFTVTGNTFNDNTKIFDVDDLVYIQGAANGANNGFHTVVSATDSAVTTDATFTSEDLTDAGASLTLVRQNLGA